MLVNEIYLGIHEGSWDMGRGRDRMLHMYIGEVRKTCELMHLFTPVAPISSSDACYMMQC